MGRKSANGHIVPLTVMVVADNRWRWKHIFCIYISRSNAKHSISKMNFDEKNIYTNIMFFRWDVLHKIRWQI
jgi:hypothetical protein